MCGILNLNRSLIEHSAVKIIQRLTYGCVQKGKMQTNILELEAWFPHAIVSIKTQI